MKLIVISSATPVPNEHEIINSLFEEGLELFHIHKPDFSKEEINSFIQQIPSKYHNRIALHSDFSKFHSLEELKQHLPSGSRQYAFLSPIFDSISKEGYKSKFSHTCLPDRQGLHRSSQIIPIAIGTELISAISGKSIIALGGIDEDKIETCRELGFAGVAVLGAIWNSKNPIEKFKRIKHLCHAE